MDIKGRVVLVTGGASGIGKAAAALFLKAGAKVALWDRDPASLESAARELSPLGPVTARAVDVSDRAAVFLAAAETGPVDVLDNNAGIVHGGDFLSAGEESVRRTFEVNVLGPMWCTAAFLPGMIERGSGRVVLMASAAGLLGVPGMAAYSASKHAVIGFGESLRLELRKSGRMGVGVTIVCPSFVKTGMFEGVKPPLLTPWLDPADLAVKVVDAVARDRLWVREPFMVKLVPALKGLTCPGITDWVGDLLGMHRAMEEWTGRRKG
ncbi:MAG: SDR family NAD(P)-dependent oxidoreductase [Elusimicrobia bacterium]|nr:SDR family NAD(P)-dependent oxidoreductase [Elusimicrobiota bacterium]